MYSDHSIASLADIPPLVQAFASSLGITTAGSSANPTFTMVSGGMTFTMAAATPGGTGTGVDHTLTLTGPGGTTPAMMYSPRRLAVPMNYASLTPLAPIKLMMHGAGGANPFISITVCYSFNLYRHMYMGVLEAIGGVTGGEIIAGTRVTDAGYDTGHPGYQVPYNGYNNAYLFRNQQNTMGPTTGCGGVNLNHASNPQPWRQFYSGAALDGTTYDNLSTIAGFGDGMVEPYLARGRMLAANAALLVPIEIYATRVGNTLVPCGRIPGIRLIDMSNIDPETVISIGADNWRCFPATARNISLNAVADYGAISTDSSWMLGYAFKE